MSANLLSDEISNITGMLASIAALGTAAFGLVDVTKVFWGGISRAGFGYILKALKPFEPALRAAGGDQWRQTIQANWINGVAEDAQKAAAKSMIHLGLSPDNAAQLARSGRVDPAALLVVVTSLDAGIALTPADINVLGRFDAILDTALDGGFERADQLYRNAAKSLAAVIAIVLAIAGEHLLWVSRGCETGTISAVNNCAASAGHFVGSGDFWLAVLVGAVSVPLAPVAKDISTSLATAVSAMKASGG
jgi:hypothetical protein